MNKIVAGPTFVRKRALSAVGLFQVANETHRAVAGLGELAAGDGELAIVIIDEDTVAADGVEPAILDGALARALGKDGSAAMNGPVAQRRNVVARTDMCLGMGKAHAFDR